MMGEFDPAAAVRALEERGVLGRPCPMCGEGPWDVGDDGFFQVVELQENVTDAVKNISSVAVQCRHCGFLALHSAAVLGLG